MGQIASIALLVLPWWVSRLFLLKSYHPLGFMQDALLASLVCIIPFAPIKVACGALLTLFIVLDGAIYRAMGMRFEVPFLSFMFGLHHFWASAKEYLWYVPLILALTAGAALSLMSLPQSLFYPIVLIGLYIPKKAFYKASNLVFLWASYFFKRRVGEIDTNLIEKHFTPKAEKMVFVSTQYPLLKQTVGFQGKKAFDVRVESDEKPHVIFLLMESFRSKDLHHAPNFNRLSKEGIFFPNFYANSVKTSRALTSVLFGVPSDVSGRDLSNEMDYPLISVGDVFKESGYETGYFHNGPLEFENQLQICANHGFNKIIGKNEIFSKYPQAAMTSWGVPDEFLMQYTLEHLKHATAAQFLTLFTMTNHHPWIQPPGFIPPEFGDIHKTYQRYLSTYTYSDWALGEFVRLLKETGLSKNVVLFVMGDHGQPMGEHEVNFIQQRALYEENIHVPLLILADGRVDPALDTRLASHIDLFPTAMDIAGVSGLNHAVGSSLVREFKRDQVFFHNPFVFGYFGTRKKDEKLIYTRSTENIEHYNLKSDPLEKNNGFPNHNQKLLHEINSYEKTFEEIYGKKRFCPPKLSNHSCSLKGVMKALEYSGILVEADLSEEVGLRDDMVLKLVKKHPEIVRLKLQNNATISDQIFSIPLENLNHLDISHCLLLTDQGINQALQAYPQLSDLYMCGLGSTGATLFEGDDELPLISFIRLKDTYIGDKELLSIGKRCTHLSKVQLSLKKLTAEGLVAFAKVASEIEELYLFDCDKINDKVILSFRELLPKLNYLTMDDCYQITDHSLEVLTNSKLKNLILKRAHMITDDGMKHLARAPLRLLSLEGCQGVTSKGTDFVMKNTSCLKILTIDTSIMMSKYSAYDL